jgi:hypothetical protein
MPIHISKDMMCRTLGHTDLKKLTNRRCHKTDTHECQLALQLLLSQSLHNGAKTLGHRVNQSNLKLTNIQKRNSVGILHGTKVGSPFLAPYLVLALIDIEHWEH